MIRNLATTTSASKLLMEFMFDTFLLCHFSFLKTCSMITSFFLTIRVERNDDEERNSAAIWFRAKRNHTKKEMNE